MPTMTRRAGSFTFAGDAPRKSGRRRWIVALALPLLVGLGVWWYFQPSARPALVSSLLGDVLPVAPSATTTLYRWQDENGEWVVSDRPPPDGVAYEEVRYREDTNVLPPADPADDD